MAATLNLTFSLTGTISGSPIRFGSSTVPDTITLSADNHVEKTQTIGNNTTWVAWDATGTTEPLTTFLVCVIETTVDMLLELTCDANNGVGDELLVLKLKGGIPFILGSNYSIANYTANFGGGTADVIDRIRIRNESGGSGVVRVLLAE
jgi:hypothetical protein